MNPQTEAANRCGTLRHTGTNGTRKTCGCVDAQSCQLWVYRCTELTTLGVSTHRAANCGCIDAQSYQLCVYRCTVAKCGCVDAQSCQLWVYQCTELPTVGVPMHSAANLTYVSSRS
jgi:hypothetical protein